ncbi:AMP-binding protein [Streptomyces sp. NA04227]|uniref:AMP-dependent synthetase/ligase n=1 Tax=Streptomyces sp. NA04227 TaxID=2742136 RepID=UPI00158FFEDB|nr:AMP-binding protein [Streptomyces sp. NA04227]QKW10296.1 AMP-binding protein [Streptomyces sp. NA04227]
MREFTTPSRSGRPAMGGLADALFDAALRDPYRVVALTGGRAGDAGPREVRARELRDQVSALARGMLAHGIRFGDRVAVMSDDGYACLLVDLALWCLGAVPVPVPAAAPAWQAHRIIEGTGAVACFLQNEIQALTVGPLCGGRTGLRHLWQLDTGALDRLCRSGTELDEEPVERHRRALVPDSIASIVHTAGTTGPPKACVLTHGALAAGADALAASCWPPAAGERSGEHSGQPCVALAAPPEQATARLLRIAALRHGLPLAHLPSGGEAGHEADRSGLTTLRPSFLLAPATRFEHSFAAVRREAHLSGRTGAFGMAVDIAVKYAEACQRRARGEGPGPGRALRVQHQLFDRAFYAGVRERFGGRLERAIALGAGPQPRLVSFFTGAGVPLHTGYGLTEFAGPVTLAPPEHPHSATAGRPVPGTTVHVDEHGRIWVRGPQTFTGYHGDLPRTRQALSGGWLNTGDLGVLDPDGHLTVTGRAADVFALRDGRLLAPRPIEERVRAHPLVAHCVVVGHGMPRPTALITLDADAVTDWLALSGLRGVTAERYAEDSRVQDQIAGAVKAAGPLCPPDATIRAFRILPTAFHRDSTFLTPAGTIRRDVVREHFAKEIAALYEA